MEGGDHEGRGRRPGDIMVLGGERHSCFSSHFHLIDISHGWLLRICDA